MENKTTSPHLPFSTFPRLRVSPLSTSPLLRLSPSPLSPSLTRLASEPPQATRPGPRLLW